MTEQTKIEWCTSCGCELTPLNRSEKGRLRCKPCRNKYHRDNYKPKGPPERYGPEPHPPRSGDKLQARQRINVEVKNGKRPHPNELPCADCGHLWEEGERRHEYDHHLGYEAEHHLEVEAVCTTCHAARDSKKARQTHCSRGHEFTEENTGRKPNGTRYCRICRRAYDRGRRDAEYWREYRRKKNGNKK